MRGTVLALVLVAGCIDDEGWLEVCMAVSPEWERDLTEVWICTNEAHGAWEGGYLEGGPDRVPGTYVVTNRSGFRLVLGLERTLERTTAKAEANAVAARGRIVFQGRHGADSAVLGSSSTANRMCGRPAARSPYKLPACVRNVSEMPEGLAT